VAALVDQPAVQPDPGADEKRVEQVLQPIEEEHGGE
jgi:hypothetical protein